MAPNKDNSNDLSGSPLPPDSDESAANVTAPGPGTDGQPASKRPRGRLKRWILIGIAIAAVVVLALTAKIIRAGWVFYQHGMFDAPTGMRQYHGDRDARLKAMQAALMQYQTSEGQFPDASGWMKAIESRIQSNDMTKAQSDLKLHDPSVKGSGWGWGFNKELSGKYIGDIKDPDTTILVYTSKNTQFNDAGDPKTDMPNPPRDGENLGVTVSGKVVKL